MAIITYARSSSIKNLSFCQMQYFLTYNLGYLREANVKAQLGTTAHKVLEWISIAKKYIQDNPNGDTVFIEEGLDTCTVSDFYKVSILKDEEVDKINSSRIAKSIYKTDASIQYGHKRVGVEYVNYLIEKAIEYYKSKCSGEWTRANSKQVENWVWMELDYKNGIYDPRFLNIKSPEQKFDIAIDKPWAKYDFGKGVTGNFAIKGTVDLITELNKDTLEIIDFKTGQRYDWAKAQTITYSSLCKDTQLMLYYYAVRKLYPEYKNVILTIFYIRDGGPFTVSFEDEDMFVVESKLEEHFNTVKNMTVPEMCHSQQLDFKCTKLCPFYKEEWPGTGLNTCRFINSEIKRIGIDRVNEIYIDDNHSHGKYSSPGE